MSDNILRVRNIAQKVLWEHELSGQISDGHWENSTPHDHWKPWCNAKIVVDPDNVGRNFYARRESYNFTAGELLEVVGERMLESVRVLTGNAEYSEREMKADLNDLKRIIKLHCADTPIPKQPKTWRAKIALEGWPKEYTVFVPMEDDPAAVAIIEKREQEQAVHELKRVEKSIAETEGVLATLEAKAAGLREKLGMLV